MKFLAGNAYHIYNRGINKQVIFFSHRNYLFFLDKIKKYIAPHCEILAYCLMPNHFHLLIYATTNSEFPAEHCGITRNVISEGIRLMLSSYAKAINLQQGRTGNLFQQGTNFKEICTGSIYMHPLNEKSDYLECCFDYIHNNPVAAGLVFESKSWKYSSAHEYNGSGDSICN